ncbi:MAG: hypothetical protein NT027_08550 [Proteobacteria bacterium]|nr:hypothetical protein [Pseudomonadota bacterium]
MRIYFCSLLLSLLWFAGCRTVVIPLPGTHIMRPKAGIATAGARISSGSAYDPSVEGILDEIKAEDGHVINPVPGTIDNAATSSSTSSTSASTTPHNTPMPVVEIAIDGAERYEVNLSSERGLSFMYDYALWPNASLSITPSYNSISIEGGSSANSLEEKYSGKAKNFNLTQLGSVWVGNLKWAAAFLYVGIGGNFFEAEIEEKNTGVGYRKFQFAPTVLGGFSLRLLIFEITGESTLTRLRYRDGSIKNVQGSALTGSLHLAI